MQITKGFMTSLVTSFRVPIDTLTIITVFLGGARGVMVIVVGNGHGDTSSIIPLGNA